MLNQEVILYKLKREKKKKKERRGRKGERRKRGNKNFTDPFANVLL